MRLEELLIEMSEEMKIPRLKLSDAGTCELLVNETEAITIEKMLDEEAFYIYSIVGAIPHGQEKNLALEALSGNLFGKSTGQASLGYFPDANSLVLFERLKEEAFTGAEFKAKIEEFSAYLKMWRAKLELPTNLKNHIEHPPSLNRTGELQIFFA